MISKIDQWIATSKSGSNFFEDEFPSIISENEFPRASFNLKRMNILKGKKNHQLSLFNKKSDS